MTVSALITRNDITATASQTVFIYTFRVIEATDMAVYQNGVLLSSGYTVTGVNNTTGGTVVLDVGASVGQIVSLVLAMPLDRTTNYQNSGKFLASNVNEDFDKIYIGAIQNENEGGRSLRLKDVEPPTTGVDMTIPLKADRLGKFLSFNATTGAPEVSLGTGADAYDSAAWSAYNFTSNGSTTAFALGIVPHSENNTQVYIDGVYQQKDGYSLSGSTITFSVAPPNLSTIEVMVTSALPVGSTSSDLVSYLPAGTGAVATTVQAKLRESVSVKDFGAVGDGVTDDTAAWLALSTFLQNTPTAVVANANDIYKITSPIEIKSDFNFEANGATIKPVGCSSLIVSKTQVGTSTTASANIAVNTNFITVADASAFAAGNLVKIKSTLAWMLDPTPTESIKKGSINKINRISGNIIYFEKLLTDNYLIASETITLTKIDSVKVHINNLNIDFGPSEAEVGIQITGDDGGVIQNCTINKAQVQGFNLINCYKTKMVNHVIHESNNVGLGYGIQINACTDIKVHCSSFSGCRRGVDLSGDIPTRGCDIAFNSADGSGLDNLGNNLSANTGSSGFGSHEGSEFNNYRNNQVSGSRFGILLRGKDEVVSGNYFYQDIIIACVQCSKSINFTVQANQYTSGLRPGKTLVSGDNQQKNPYFVSMTDPAVNGGFYKILDNAFSDLKNAFLAVTLTTSASFSTLTNVTITGNTGKIVGIGSETVFFVESIDQAFTISDSVLINNNVSEESGQQLELYSAGITLDYINTVDIDNLNFGASDGILAASGGTMTINEFQINMCIKHGEVSITGYADFNITGSSAVVKLQNIPSKLTVGGSYGPSYSFPFVASLTTSSAGSQGMIAMPSGSSGSIPTSAWLSSNLTQYNGSWAVGNNYKVPLNFKYFTERRLV